MRIIDQNPCRRSARACRTAFLCAASAIAFSSGTILQADPVGGLSEYPFAHGFVTMPIVLTDNFSTFVMNDNQSKDAVAKLCDQIKKTYVLYKWDPGREGCGSKINWKSTFKSHDGTPLIWAEFGTGSSTTLILGGVHPDELTPIPLVFRFANHLAANPELVGKDSRVIIAPIVNPDGFFRKTTTRTNTHGVDLNRNFFTRDWYTSAKHWWAERRQKNERHFPGHLPNSEIETLFQIWLIDNFKPDKIISIHAPLGFYDYDGPGEHQPKGLTESQEKAKRLVRAMSESSRNYKIVDYSFYPGSLGNYAGNERGIPTVTLELETTNPEKLGAYWQQFSPGLEQAVRYPYTNPIPQRPKRASLFLNIYGRMANADAEDRTPHL